MTDGNTSAQAGDTTTNPDWWSDCTWYTPQYVYPSATQTPMNHEAFLQRVVLARARVVSIAGDLVLSAEAAERAWRKIKSFCREDKEATL
jgi:hypothetical protein